MIANHSDIIALVAKDNDLPVEFVNNVYKGYWSTIREIMLNLPLKEQMTEEEFNKLRPNINISRIGKFHVEYPRYMSLKRQYQWMLDNLGDKDIE